MKNQEIKPFGLEQFMILLKFFDFKTFQGLQQISQNIFKRFKTYLKSVFSLYQRDREKGTLKT